MSTVTAAGAVQVARARRVSMPVALGGLSLVLVAAGFAFGVHLPNLHNGLIAATFTTVGVLVLAKRPGNREGWLFVAAGLAHAVMFSGRQYGVAASEGAALPAAAWVQWVGVWPLALVLVLAGVTFMCFPDGRLPSPRWRVVVAAMTAVGLLLALTSALWPVEYLDNGLSLGHPLDVGGGQTAQRAWDVVGPTSYALFQVAWVACVVSRLRHAEDDEARQLRWFAYAVAVSAAAVLGSAVAVGSPTPGLLTVPVVALAAGLAIVKYRLYDIDLVINKTLVVGSMAALVTAGYVAVVVGVGQLVGLDAGPSPVLPLVATAMVAVAFEPFRRRVQTWADHLVYGNRPTPYEALARLPSQLSRGGQDDDLFAALATTVAEGVGAADVTLWVGSRDALVPVGSWPPQTGQDARPAHPISLASLAASGSSQVRPIEHQGTVRGAVTFTKAPGEQLTGSEARLLDDLVAQAGLVIDHVALGVELQHRLQQISEQSVELRAAARRIVSAQDEGRMRIERNLHDGAQQQLVTLALSLQSVSERAASTGNEGLAAQVELARHQLSQALTELRDLARGIHPALLTHEGLEAAVTALAERAPLPVQVDLHLDHRLAQDVEVTAYFVVSEALANGVKHAHASKIAVVGGLRDAQLTIEVTDDGRGGADPRRGSGLQGLVDRLATSGGRLTVTSPVGGGTRLRAVIPCA